MLSLCRRLLSGLPPSDAITNSFIAVFGHPTVRLMCFVPCIGKCGNVPQTVEQKYGVCCEQLKEDILPTSFRLVRMKRNSKEAEKGGQAYSRLPSIFQARMAEQISEFGTRVLLESTNAVIKNEHRGYLLDSF